MCYQQRLRSACAYAQTETDQSLCLSPEYSISVKLVTGHHLEFLSFKGGCTGMRRSRNFFQGGPGPMVRKLSGRWFFFALFFLVLNLFYCLQRGSNGCITEKAILFQGSRGSPTFFRWGGGGSNFFPGGGGVQMLISIETHITFDFPWGGGGSPDLLSPPLDRTGQGLV